VLGIRQVVSPEVSVGQLAYGREGACLGRSLSQRRLKAFLMPSRYLAYRSAASTTLALRNRVDPAQSSIIQ